MHKSAITISTLMMASLIMLVPFASTNIFTNTAMAQGYDDEYSYYVDNSYYSTYPVEDKNYECRKGPFEGFFVSSVEFCKNIKFEDKKDRDNKVGPQGPPGPPGSGNNNSTLVNTFNCINPNVININTDTNQSSPTSSSGLQQLIQNGVAQGLNATLGGLSQNNLNKTIVNLCFINDNDNIVIEGSNATNGNGNVIQNCEECFDVVFAVGVPEFLATELGFFTVGQLCNAISTGEISVSELRSGILEALGNNPEDIPLVDSLIQCLRIAGILNP